MRDVEFMSTPFDLDSADMLAKLGMRRVKVPSGEITNLPLLEGIAGLELPIILSTGMSTLVEVTEAVDTIRAAQRRSGAASVRDALILLHCTSNYPAAPDEVNLRAMMTLLDNFAVPVGYSDHTQGLATPVGAVALGAVVLEKHFTLDCSLPGPDHRASLEPPFFGQMVQMIREVESALGTGIKAPVPSELPIRDLVRRSVTITRHVRTGEALRASDLALLRPGTGISPRELGAVVGRRVARDLDAGTTLMWNDLLP
jgi:sialic acid synthase SpsE